MDDEEILEEAKLTAEIVAEKLANIHLPSKEIDLCKEGVLPDDTWTVMQDLRYASNRMSNIIIEIDEWKDVLSNVEHGELFFKRHMLALITAVRSLQTEVNEARRFIRDKTRVPLKIDKPWYLVREGEV